MTLVGRYTAGLYLCLGLIVSGCASPGVKLFPMSPVQEVALDNGRLERRFDTNDDGAVDYAEVSDANGQVVLLRYDTNADNRLDRSVAAPIMTSGDVRHLIIILDSIPFHMVKDMHDRGRFGLFHPPSRTVAPFPVLTDLCISEFFGVSPCRATEAQHYNGKHRNTGYLTYAATSNSHWVEELDYHLPFSSHALVYSKPEPWYDHELKQIQDQFLRRTDHRFIGYVVSTSALGARLGRSGHQAALVKLDRFCQRIVMESEGRVHITLLSDHGHGLTPSRRIDLTGALQRAGYRVRKSLQRPGDVVVVEFGIVTCAAIHTSEPASVAGDLIGVEGIELAAYRDGDGHVAVIGREGFARISRKGSRYRYEAVRGDPLFLEDVMAELEANGDADSDGFVDGHQLWLATRDHIFPDVVHRLWRCFHGLVTHTPDVLLSITDDYHCGSKMMSEKLRIQGVHGSLRKPSSSGFVMTTAGDIGGIVRMEDLRETLANLGVPIDKVELVTKR